jgi:hypothetical protein
LLVLEAVFTIFMVRLLVLRLRHFLLLLAGHPALGWISTSQARYGAQIEDLAAGTRGESTSSAFRSLGWLWHAPYDALDTRGLGGGITYAVDPALCSHLLPRVQDGAWAMQFLAGCSDLRASIARGLSVWAVMHPLIAFTDVTHVCEASGELVAGATSCTHAELFLTLRDVNASALVEVGTGNGDDEGDGEIAQTTLLPRLTNTFRHTNGEEPVVRLGSTEVPRQMVEVTGGRIAFDNHSDTCWYLDSALCAPFHSIALATSASGAFAGGSSLVFLFWAAAVVYVLVDFGNTLKARLDEHRARVKAAEAARQVKAERENVYWRSQVVLSAIASQSLRGTTARLFLLIAPWAFYMAILRGCFYCHDFEATLAHQAGHLLGLAHPDAPPAAQLAPSHAHDTPGNNSFNAYLAGGGVMNETHHCRHVWDDVRAGVPMRAAEGGHGGASGGGGEIFHVAASPPSAPIRPALMRRLHPASTDRGACLRADDLEGLLTLYPVCSGAALGAPLPPSSSAAFPDPPCHLAPTNRGVLTILAAFVFPALLAIGAAYVLQRCFVAPRLRSLREQTNHGLGSRATSLAARAAAATRGGLAAAAGKSSKCVVSTYAAAPSEEDGGSRAGLAARRLAPKKAQQGGGGGGGGGGGSSKAAVAPHGPEMLEVTADGASTLGELTVDAEP